jgi:NCAIR mutase (PurE)-related protein
MNEAALKSLLEQVQQGDRSIDEAVEQLRHLPFEDIGDAVIDHHRTLRQGFPEVIFGANKTVDQITRIMAALLSRGSNVLATRLDEQQATLLLDSYPAATWHREARCLTIEQQPVKITGRGTILVISAGTSDIPVAAEAVVTARIMGNQVEQLFDVGVAGLHRLLARRELLYAASVLIVVAGMEGALPSVVGGMVSRPVIAVPTSVGYGASFGGIAALLGMLNSCASGVTVVNIDNGFGAGYAASLMNRE